MPISAEHSGHRDLVDVDLVTLGDRDRLTERPADDGPERRSARPQVRQPHVMSGIGSSKIDGPMLVSCHTLPLAQLIAPQLPPSQ